MTGKYSTIFEKFYYKLFIKLNKGNECFYKHRNIDKTRRMVLYLDYPKFIHLGDILWCEPIARLLAANFDLAVCCNPPMQFYFSRLGYQTINKSLISKNDLLIARMELAHHLKGRDVLWINFDYTKISRPLINAVLSNLAAYLALNSNDARPRALDFLQTEKNAAASKFGIDSGCYYAVLNNYVDTLKFGVPHNAYLKASQALVRFAEKYKQHTGIKIIHTGTKKDKSDNYRGIADLDLRGLTSAEECFIIASLSNVVQYIGFDSFLLHLFNMYDKDSLIMIRSGFSETIKKQIKNFVAVPYTTEKNKIKYIE